MDAITADVRAALATHGFDDVDVSLVLAPAWTTDWMSDAGKQKLLAYGIVPPQPRPDRGPRADGGSPVMVALSLRCPQCGSGGHPGAQPFRVDRVQVLVGVQLLQGTVRPLQVPLTPASGSSKAIRA